MTETLASPTTEYGADALIVCDNLVRIYQVENIEVQALQGLDLLVDKGEMIAIVGQSGSGKSTLLNVLSGLDVPTAGAARVAGWDLLRMNHADRLTYRRSVVGFVWQQTARNLLPYLSARENVMLPMAFGGMGGRKRKERAGELLDAMGMADKAGRRPAQLSGGEQQRVAIAVALANSPEVIFADEPTGELDSSTGDDVFEALRAANRDLGATVVVVTHDHAVSSQVQRTVAIRDGRTATEVVRRTHVDDEGRTQTVHDEYAVLDRAGRMQLPKDYRDALGLKDRVRLELESDHVGVWNDKVPHRDRTPQAPVATPEPDSAASPDAADSTVPPVAETPSRPAVPVAPVQSFAPPSEEVATPGSDVTASAPSAATPPAWSPSAATPPASSPSAPRSSKVPQDYDVNAALGDDAPYAPPTFSPPPAEDADDSAPAAAPETPVVKSPFLPPAPTQASAPEQAPQPAPEPSAASSPPAASDSPPAPDSPPPPRNPWLPVKEADND